MHCFFFAPKNAHCTVGSSVVARKAVSGKLPLSSVLTEDGISGSGGSDAERGDATRIASIPPARVPIPSDSPVIQVACGLHHTVALLQNGEVFSFGSNIYGQLGVGDLIAHAGPVQVKIPTAATQIAAGSNHTVVLTVKGEVYSCGAYQVEQNYLIILREVFYSGRLFLLHTKKNFFPPRKS